MSEAERIVIVGGGPAAKAAAEAYREAGGAGAVTILAREADPPYERPPLTKGFLRGESGREELPLADRRWYKERGVDLRTGAEVTELDLDQWRSVFDNNVVATMLTLKHGGRELVRAGGGSFVSISSLSAHLTARFASPISSAKVAIEQLCRIAAVELGPSDVTVNVIRPGLVQVPRQDLPPEMERDFLSIIPLHRLGEPRDIAGIVRFLVGPEARWITGQVISVDGGQTLNRAFDATPWVEPVFGKERMRGLVR